MKTAIKHNRTGWATGIAMVLIMSAAPSYAGRDLDGDRDPNPPKANVQARDDKPGGPHVLPLDSKPFGQSYQKWAADFSRWLYSTPYDVNPFIPGNLNCTRPQHGKVWFIATGSEKAACEVPEEKAIFVTLGGYTDTYPCPDPGFGPSPGQSLEAFLTADAKYIVDNYIPPHKLSIDGKLVVDNGLEQRVSSEIFTLTGDLSLNPSFDSCITGKPQKAVSDGSWAIIVGLAPGKHKLEFILGDVVTNTLNVNIIHD